MVLSNTFVFQMIDFGTNHSTQLAKYFNSNNCYGNKRIYYASREYTVREFSGSSSPGATQGNLE